MNEPRAKPIKTPVPDSSFVFSWHWNSYLSQLKTFRALNGHCSVPPGYKENPELSLWVQHQRKHYHLWKRMKPADITPVRIQALEQVGFEWEEQPTDTVSSSDSEESLVDDDETPEPAITLNKKWTERMEELVRFREEHGHCRVPRRYPENPSFGSWVHYIRRQARLWKQNRPSRLTVPHIKMLEDAGFEWEAGKGPGHASTLQNKKWYDRLEELKEFRAIHGHCRVPARYADTRPSLGYWVRDQRQQFRLFKEKKPSRLTAKRVKALNDIGFEWKAKRGPKTGSGRKTAATSVH